MNTSDKYDLKKTAKELRKAGNYSDARGIYAKLWNESRDKFDGVGLLNSLRKLKLFDEAVPLADELAPHCIDLEWCRVEVIWTYIEGVLSKLSEEATVQDVLPVAKKIMDLNPDGLALKLVVFKVLKVAKALGKWEVVDEWVVKIDPAALSMEPMKTDNGREGWSDQSLWYNYRLNALLEKEDFSDVIRIVDEISSRFLRQRKFFLRLKAIALHKVGELDQAQKLYSDICRGKHTEWWLLHEYATVISDNGHKEEALAMMCQSALSCPNVEMSVTLYADIGQICLDLAKDVEAGIHLSLSKLIRQEKGWSLPQSLTSSLARLSSTPLPELPMKETLDICRLFWNEIAGGSANRLGNRPLRKENIHGQVLLGPSDRPYCFIKTKSDGDVFCFKSDLPADSKEGDWVSFDTVPSFDKKKNRAGLRAQNIRHVGGAKLSPHTTHTPAL